MNITKELREKSQSVIKELDLKEVFVNEKGEFFSQENLAGLSVKGDKKKYEKILKTGTKEEINEPVVLTEETAKSKLLSTEKIDTLEFNTELKPLFKALKLGAKDGKKTSLIKALEDHKASLIQSAKDTLDREIKDAECLLEQKNGLKETLETALDKAEADQKGSIQESINRTAIEISDIENKIQTLKGE